MYPLTSCFVQLRSVIFQCSSRLGTRQLLPKRTIVSSINQSFRRPLLSPSIYLSLVKLTVAKSKFSTLILLKRNFSSASRNFNRPNSNNDKGSVLMLCLTMVVMVLGGSYAAVPLYRIYCQKTGKGGQAVLENDINERVAKLEPIRDRKIQVSFEADKSSRLAWDFKPSQKSITVAPGETVLAFYSARNHLDRPVNGIATYNILPYEAGQYFNKIQCFCFEEQQLNANEEVDLPVFFFIDPEYTKDPFLFDVDDIVLSYSFFETKEGYKLPLPPPVRIHRSPELKKSDNVTTNLT